MPKSALSSSLENLHVALGDHADLTAEDRALLRTVLADIQSALEQKQPHPPEAIVRLESAALRYTEQHPALAGVVQEVIVALRGAGL
jgi:hypothetical protein